MNFGRRAFFLAGAAVTALAGGTALIIRPFSARAITAAEKNACALTVAATEGPLHVTGVGELQDGNLNFTGLSGLALEVSGHVYEGLDDSKPISGAAVEIWHADSDGNYHPNGNGPIAKYKPEEIALRGFVLSDAAGVYRFKSIYPGEYTGRPRHFHFKIKAPGKPELTTQLIVPARQGDRLTFDSDDIAEGLPNCQLLTIDETQLPAKARFDFRL